MREVDTLLQREMQELISDIRTNMKAAGQNATGKTAASLEARVGNGKAELWGASYFSTLETGRGPAKGGTGNGDFLRSLKEWIIAKGLQYSSDADLERLARYLKWRINKFGTKLFRSGGRKDIFTPPIEAFEQRIAEETAVLYRNEIIKMI